MITSWKSMRTSLQGLIYTVAHHHWPEELITKNKNEKRGISKLINRTEALHYGLHFVEKSELPNDDVSSESSIFLFSTTTNRIECVVNKHPVYLKSMYLRSFQPSTALQRKELLILVFLFHFLRTQHPTPFPFLWFL
jgi:hypothetical protein